VTCCRRYSPRILDYALFSEEIRAFDRAFFISGFEDQAIAEVASKHAGFLTAERRDE
jgi:hypothetical protein